MTALYVHIPFCVKKCPYCDFLSFTGRGEAAFLRYAEAAAREMTLWHDENIALDTIFFGGGTPSLVGADALLSMLDAARQNFTVNPDAEISLEANPGTVDRAALARLRAGGFNRVSFGVQSFDDALLRQIGRIHDGETAARCVEDARAAGFARVSVDLMSGLPTQRAADLEASIRRAAELGATHISCYDLTLAEGTPFAQKAARGELPLPDEDAAADMLFSAWDTLAVLGYEHYEVSNFARPGERCRHNLHYWRGDDYVGIGCGAHGRVGDVRYAHAETVEAYIRDVDSGERVPVLDERLTPYDDALETVMTGLRTRDGVDLERALSAVSRDVRDRWTRAAASAVGRGFAVRDGARLRPTEAGWRVMNAWLVEFF